MLKLRENVPVGCYKNNCESFHFDGQTSLVEQGHQGKNIQYKRVVNIILLKCANTNNVTSLSFQRCNQRNHCADTVVRSACKLTQM